MTQQVGVSLKPSDMVSGGLIDNVNAVITTARFAVWDYGGRAPVSTLAAKIDLRTEEGVEATQYYSAGDPHNFVPSSDGRRVVAVGNATALNENSNLATFLKSLVNAGFPENRITDDISALEGLDAFFQRVAAPDRPGLVRSTDASARPQTILVVTKINALPGEVIPKVAPASARGRRNIPAAVVGAGVRTPTSVPAPAPVAPSGDSSDLMSEAMGFLMDVLTERGSIQRNQLTGLVFTKQAGNPRRNDLAKLVFSPDFLVDIAEMGVAIVDGDTISAA